MIFALALVVVISVAAILTGINAFNTSNVAIFTNETPGETFGDGDYQTYLDPTQVGVDFGTNSITYQMALSLFNQQPNILTGGGELVIIPLEQGLSQVFAIQHLVFSTVPTTGTYKLTYPTLGETAVLGPTDGAAEITAAIQALGGVLASTTVTGEVDEYGNTGYDVTFLGIDGPATLLVVSEDSLQDEDGEDVFITPTTTTIGVVAKSQELLGAAITRTKDMVQYFGIMEATDLSNQTTPGNVPTACSVVQGLNKMAFFVSYTAADVESGGTIDKFTTGGFTHSRGLLYIRDQDATKQLVMMAAYAGSGLSTDFSGSNTTSTRHLKQLIGVQPDDGIDGATRGKALIAGADLYISIEGRASVFCSGANSFFDQVYNLAWLQGALQVAVFNYLAQSSTKIPQTDPAMEAFKGAIRKVMEQGVTNGYLAPGTWDSPTTFGNQTDLLANVKQFGYYLYSAPVGTQSQADRRDRKAPLVQAAVKEAGAVHSASIIVNINQ